MLPLLQNASGHLQIDRGLDNLNPHLPLRDYVHGPYHTDHTDHPTRKIRSAVEIVQIVYVRDLASTKYPGLDLGICSDLSFRCATFRISSKEHLQIIDFHSSMI